MVKLGEVEFLVKFDTVSRTFAETLREALGDEGLIDNEEIENKLDKIEGHLGILVTPFSGNRMVDLIKSRGYIAQLKDPKWIEKKVETIASSPMLLKKLGIEEAPSSEEAKEAAREKFDIFTKDIADFIKVTVSSEAGYLKNFPTLQDIIGLLTVSTEGNIPYLIEKIMNKLKAETEVDKAVYKWLKDEMDIDISNVTQRIWDRLTKDVEPEEGTEIEVETEVKTSQDFLDLIGKILELREDKEELREEIFSGDPTKASEELKDFIREELKAVTFKGGIQVPRVFRKGLEEARGLEKGELYDVKLRNIKNDIKFILKDIEKIEPIVEQMGKGLSPEEREDLIERAKEAIQSYGWYYFIGESKVYGDERKLAAEKKKMKAGAAKELLTSAQWGTVFSLFTEYVGSQISVEKTEEEMKRTAPEQMVKMLEGNKEFMEHMYTYMKGNRDSVIEGLSEEMRVRFEEVMDKFGILFGEL